MRGIPEHIRRFFVEAVLEQDWTIGVKGAERVRRQHYLYRGCWNLNNSTLACIDLDGRCWVLSMRIFGDDFVPEAVRQRFLRRYQCGLAIVRALEAAGFERGEFYVPHSNDSGEWIRKRLPVTKEQLVEEIWEEILEDRAARRVAFIEKRSGEVAHPAGVVVV